MKKFLIALLLILACNLTVLADTYSDYYGDIKDIWTKNGKYEEKVLKVAYNILNKNDITKHIAIKVVVGSAKKINAYAIFFDKSVLIDKGILPYLDNDDELAAILSHEIAHTLDMHTSFGRQMAMCFAPVRYEAKADLVGVDLMAKAGYNPLAMISALRKIAGEHEDFGSTHPRGSSRLTYIHRYIKKYYPTQLLSSQYRNNPFYINAMKIVKANKKSPYGITTMGVPKIAQKEKIKRIKTAIENL